MGVEQVPLKDLKFRQWHDDLPDAAKERIARTYRIVGRFMDPTLEQWEHGFCYDLHYDAEIRIWERISLAFIRFAREHRVAAESDPAMIVALLASASTGADIAGRPFAKQIVSCLRNPTKGLRK